MEKPDPKTSPTSGLAGKTALAPAPPSVAGGAAIPAAADDVAAAQSVPLFGGHRGGGKRRTDGLSAGSAEAVAADKAKDRARKQASRDAGRGTPLPAALPSVAAPASAPAADPGAAVAGGASVVPGAAAVPGVAVVLWNPRLLEKPARLVTRLVTRIVDRVRKAAFRKKLDHPKLPAEMKAEIERDLQMPNEALADFSTALADCAAVELNKRGVGAGQSHWLTLAGSMVELGTHHVQAMERLDKLLAKLEEEKPEGEKVGKRESEKAGEA